MPSRAALIAIGLLVAFTLGEIFGVPQRLSVLLGLLPFAIAEAKGLINPYEQSGRDIMHDGDSRKRK